MNLRIGRNIFVLLVALSVAMLPAAIGAASATTNGKTMDASVSATMPDCDHHHHVGPSDTTQKAIDDGACMANCTLACFGFPTPRFSSLTFLLATSTVLKAVRTNTHISSRVGNTPFRPPRS